MTIPSSIHLSPNQTRPVFGELSPNNKSNYRDIFRPASGKTRPSVHDVLTPKRSNTQSSWTPSICRSQSTWTPPIYRNVTLLSSPSEDFGNENTNEQIDLPWDFIPPKHDFGRGQGNGERRSNQEQQEFFRTVSMDANCKSGNDLLAGLTPEMIICGRGAPTKNHAGNLAYQDLIKEHESAYLVAKRSEKPQIAMEVLETLRARKNRFVRREKRHGQSMWVEISEQRAYEKVCQSLREGAPQIRRQLLGQKAREAIEDKVSFRDLENLSPIPF